MVSPRPYLRSISIDWDTAEDPDSYPFNIPAVKKLGTLEFHRDVTFIVGENGAGKSTLIEAIAMAMGFGAEGGTRNVQVKTADDISPLSGSLKLARSYKRPRDWYFLRAESFYNVATYMDKVGYLGGYGGRSLHEQSHGEAFFATLTQKLRGHGLYILDEPEAALSPSRQLSVLTAIHDLVQRGSQFIIATHSPIIMAYPNAKLLVLDEEGIHESTYKDTEHYLITRNFMNYPDSMLQVLLEDETP